jgi:DNA polymerase (family 10)
LLLRRDELDYDMEKILNACAKHGVAMECNAYPDRLDLKDVYLRMCKERGVKVVISTDSHDARALANIHYGVTMARRAWLTCKDVINTLPVEQFLAALRPKPGSTNAGKSASPVATSVSTAPTAATTSAEKVPGASKKPRAKKASR